MKPVANRRNLVAVTAVVALMLVSMAWVAVASAAPPGGESKQPFLAKDAVIEMTQSGNAWMGHETTTATRFAAATAFTGPGAAVISLTGPAAIGGAEYGLASFDLCVIEFSGGSVAGVDVVAIDWFGPDVNDDQYLDIPPISPDPTGQSTGCVTYEVGTPVGQGVGLMVSLDSEPSGSVELFSVKSTWTMAAAAD